MNAANHNREVRILSCSDSESWYVDQEDYDFSMFIAPFWIESLKDENKRPLYLDFFQGEKVIAKIGGFAVNSNYAFQRKFLFYAAPALKKNLPDNIIDRCIRALIRYTRTEKMCRLILLSYDSRHISNLQKKYGFSGRCEYLVDLKQDKEKIKNNISRNVKRDYKDAISHGFVFKEVVSTDMSSRLINLMKETKKVRISKGYSDYNYFYINGLNEDTLRNLISRDVIHFYCVERDSELFAVQAVMQNNQQAYALLIGVKAEGYQYGLPSFIDYSLILSLKEKNYSYINFGGVPIDKTHKGLADFKKRLGAVECFSTYGSTHFINMPYVLLNPLVRLLRKLPDNPLVDQIKRKANF